MAVRRSVEEVKEVTLNEFKAGMVDTSARDQAERHIEGFRQQGGIFVEAVRLTRMPMMVTDATLPGNPIVFANNAFVELSGYAMEELIGQDRKPTKEGRSFGPEEVNAPQPCDRPDPQPDAKNRQIARAFLT